MTKLYSLFTLLFFLAFLTGSGICQEKYSGSIHPATNSAPEVKTPTGQIIGSSYDNINAYYEEGFEGLDFPPSGWQAISVLGAKTWVRSTSVPHNGVAAAFMDYETSGGEDWLITPKMLIGSGDSLSFWLRKKFASSYPPDYLEIRVSTTDSAIGSFGASLLTIDVNTLTSITTYDRFAVSLNAYAGQRVYVAFKHYDTDGNGVTMDDVTIGTPAPNDVGMFSVDVASTLLPGSMAPLATVKNYGSAAQTFPVTMTITPGSYTSTKTVTSLAPGTVQQVTFDNWNAPLGNFTITVTTNLAGDVNPTNNSMSKNVSVTNAGWINIANIPSTTYMGAGGSCVIGDVGWVFSVGGNSATKTEAAKYNTNTNTWTPLAPVPVPRVVVTGAATNNKYYLLGGSDGAATPAYQNTIYVLDLTTNTWTLSPVTLPGVRGWNRSAVYQDSIIYIAGGYSGSVYLAEVLLFNVNNNTIRQCTPMPAGTFGGAFAISGNKMVYVGGAVSAGIVATTYVGTISPTDRSQITWTTGPAYPGGNRFRWEGANWGDKGIIVAAGSVDVNWLGTKNGYIFNPVTNTWTPIPDKTVASLGSSVGSTRRANGDTKFVLASGYDGVAAIAAGAAYADSWLVPVELTSFTATADHKSVTLNWSTATEINNSGFSVERMSNGSFETVAFVQGHGSSTEVHNYSYTDNVAAGTYTYRLKQMDYNGAFEYSNAIQVSVGTPTTFSLNQNYPNPFNPSTIISYQIPENSMVTLKVYDALGNEIAVLENGNKEAGKYTVNFNASNLSTGIYFYKLTAGNFVQTNKMLLIK